jgi:hypothetical protein
MQLRKTADDGVYIFVQFGIHEHTLYSYSQISNELIFLSTSIYNNSQDSSFGIAIGYGLDSQGSITGKVKIFLFTMDTGCFLEVKWSEHNASHSIPSRGEGKNGGVIPLLLRMSSWNSA